MPELLTHPGKDQLTAFGLGKLDSEQASRVEEHLESCADCCALLHGVGDDWFVKLVRQCESSPETAGTIGLDAGTTVSRGGLPNELVRHARYEVLELIGRGGMGDVYKAQHKVMQRQVALKLIKPELIRNEPAVRRFQREVQAAARLHHKHIVTAHDAEQAGDLHFLVMEYVDGVNLDQVIRRRGALPVAEACRYIRQAAEGLQHAHELGMVHRDIKPHNLMLSTAGVVKILDFGLANFASEVAADELTGSSAEPPTDSPIASGASLLALTQLGTMMGTPDYIAPEQARDAHAADIRADIYSLGCTFFTLLTGETPFGHGSALEKIKAHTESAAPRLRDLRADVPVEVETVVQRMMAKDRAERFQSPAEVVQALAAIETKAPAAQPASQPSPAVRRPGLFVALAALSAAVLLAAAVFYFVTDKGVVRVEVADKSLEVKFNGDTITAQNDDQPITIRAGQTNKLIVRRGDFEFQTDNFEIKRGDQIAFKVDLLPEEIVVLKDGKDFAGRSLAEVAAASPHSNKLRLLAELRGHTSVIRAVRYLPDRILSVDGDGNVYRWEGGTYDRIVQMQIPGGSYTDADISADGRWLAIASDWGATKGRVEVWDVETGKKRHALSQDLAYMEDLVFSPDGQRLVAIGKPSKVLVWELGDKPSRRDIDSGFAAREISAAAFAPNGKSLAVVCNGKVNVLDLEKGVVAQSIPLPSAKRVHDLFYAPEQQRFVALQGGAMRRVDPATGSAGSSAIDSAHETPRSGAAISGNLIVTGSDQGNLLLRDWNGAVRATARAGTGTSLHLAVSPDARRVATGGGWFFSSKGQWTVTDDYLLRIWQLPDQLVAADPNPPSRFFQTLGDLQSIVRKTATDVGLNVSRMNDTEMVNSGGPRRVVNLKVELTGAERGGILSAFRDKFRSLSTPSGAFITSVDSEMRGNVQATNLPYTDEAREGLIRVELEKTGTDQRETKAGKWSLVVRVEEWPRTEQIAPLVIGMNDDFGMLFEGRLVAPAELSRRLEEVLKENPARVVAIDLPKKKWTVAGHVDQLEQIAQVAGAKKITRPAWSEIRIVFGVINGSAQTLVIEGPGHSASGFANSYLPNVREVVAKNPGLPVLIDVAADVDLTNPAIAAGLAEVRSVAEEAGATVRLTREPAKKG